MKQHQGIWLPDQEQHMIEWMNKSGEIVDGRGTYQIRKLRAALEYVKDWRVAVDVGAHVGFWSMHLVKKFESVHAFEPVEAHRDCFYKNMAGSNNWELEPVALGDKEGMVSLVTPHGSSGGTHINGTGDIEMVPLDDYDFINLDFLKVDCEGYELKVLQGAVETLKRCKPCVIVEQKSHTTGGRKHLPVGGKPAVDFLKSIGYTLRREMGGDYIMTFGD